MSNFSVTLRCPNGHEITVPSTAKRPSCCPAWDCGLPCRGPLVQISGHRSAQVLSGKKVAK